MPRSAPDRSCTRAEPVAFGDRVPREKLARCHRAPAFELQLANRECAGASRNQQPIADGLDDGARVCGFGRGCDRRSSQDDSSLVEERVGERPRMKATDAVMKTIRRL